jgi:hypothetical protein
MSHPYRLIAQIGPCSGVPGFAHFLHNLRTLELSKYHFATSLITNHLLTSNFAHFSIASGCCRMTFPGPRALFRDACDSPKASHQSIWGTVAGLDASYSARLESTAELDRETYMYSVLNNFVAVAALPSRMMYWDQFCDGIRTAAAAAASRPELTAELRLRAAKPNRVNTIPA